MTGLILVSLAGKKTDEAALQTGITLGRRLDMHVEALHGKADPRESLSVIGPGVGGSLVQDMINAAEQDIAARVARVQALFEVVVGKEDVRPDRQCCFGVSLRVVEGGHSAMVAREGRMADLVVAARQADADDVEEILTLEAVLFESGRPVLVVPPGVGPHDYAKVAIAWDGSLEACRAVHGAMPLLTCASQVTALSVVEEGKDGEVPGGLKSALNCHDVDMVARQIPSDGAISVALLSATVEEGCGLIVMGGYGHSRLRELVLGGVTRDVLAASALPVLIAH